MRTYLHGEFDTGMAGRSQRASRLTPGHDIETPPICPDRFYVSLESTLSRSVVLIISRPVHMHLISQASIPPAPIYTMIYC